ncbi:basic salivary proline-rich protein 1-like [Drosophila gunungcola]|uniref:Uncharacterized protein n=1 Tax=Drosophila gunungcola TaxID=103775 RepID=A0A9Q0BS73_9MUSC|nr:basic salivary proline-rich protein 1-like [Drosophila gunungcola]KAI8042667.1 hypothetical protein M5D96_003984 [Drosophila gunungcola]
MSPKFGLAILLFSFVLLGIANAQQYRYPQQVYNRPYGVRNLGGSGPLPPNFPPPENAVPPAGPPPEAMDCLPNQLAAKTPDNKTPRPRPQG